MQLKTSFFSPTLFKKNVTRFWPVWSVYLLFWVFVLPVNLLGLDVTRHDLNYIPRMIFNSLSDVGLIFTFGFALLAAMAVFSYLYNARSVQMLHALPVKRGCLFLTNYLSGLFFLVIPVLLTGAAALAIQAARGLGFFGTTVTWTLLCILQIIFFYSFAVFCAMFTGHLLALPAFYIILNFLAIGLSVLLSSLFSQFVYGFYRVDWLDEVVLWFTPFVRISTNVHVSYASQDAILRFDGIPTLLLYGLIGLILAVLALVAYRRRKLESAGDVVSIRWVKPIFKYGVAFSSAIFFGSLLHNIFRDLLPDGVWSLLGCLVVAGIIGCFAAEMLLRKSFKVLRTGWKGAVAFSLALILAATAMEYDLLGFDRVPNQEAITSVTISGLDTYPNDSASYSNVTFSDPSDVYTVLELHRLLVAAKPLARGLSENETRPVAVESEAEVGLEHQRFLSLRLDYTLENGQLLHRAYDIPIYSDELKTPGTIPYVLDSLINRPAQYYGYYFDSMPAGSEATLVDASIDLFNAETGSYDTVSLQTEDDRNRLLRAMAFDMSMGSLGKRYLFDSLERQSTCAVGDLNLTFYYPGDSVVDSDGRTYASRDTWHIRVTPQTTAYHTLLALTDLGVIDDTHLMLTHADDPDANLLPRTTLVPDREIPDQK